MTFGYAPGDRVVLFREDGSIKRDDLRWVGDRKARFGGYVLEDGDGSRFEVTRVGRLVGGGSQGAAKIVRKAAQDGKERESRSHAGRKKCRECVYLNAGAMKIEAYRSIMKGETKNVREAANAIIAACDELDSLERRLAGEGEAHHVR